MPFDPANLHRDEQIVLDMHPHWIMMVKAVVAVVLSTALGVWLLFFSGWSGTLEKLGKGLAVVLIVGSLLYLLQRSIVWYSTNFVVTTDRCIYREGIISKRGVEIPLERINTIFFHQGIVERLVRAGDLMIESAGDMGLQHFEDVRDPISVQNILYQEMEDNENRKFDRIRTPHPGQGSVADEIAKLAELRDQGHLTEEEFQSQKAHLLGQPGQPPVPPT